MAELVYVLCCLASVACAVLLWRGYRRRKARLLLWSSLCFWGLSVNNALLFADKVLFPEVDLALWRGLSSMAGLLLLVIGLIWDSD